MAKPTILHTSAGREGTMLFARQRVRVRARQRVFVKLTPIEGMIVTFLRALESSDSIHVVDIKAGRALFLEEGETLSSTCFCDVRSEPAVRLAGFVGYPSAGLILNLENRGDAPCDIEFEIVGNPFAGLTGAPSSIPSTDPTA